MHLNNAEKKLVSKIEEISSELLNINKEVSDKDLENAAMTIEKFKKFRIKDYESAINYFNAQGFELFNSSDKNVDRSKMTAIDLSKNIAVKGKSIRKAKNRSNASNVDTNILTHTPFFAGKPDKIKEKAEKGKPFIIDKEGHRKTTIQNDAGEVLGMPDAKTLTALFAIWSEKGTDDWFTFTEYQLLEKMNMAKGGKQYRMVKQSLEKLRLTSIVMQEAYNIKERKRTVTERFPLIIGEKFIIDEDEETGRVKSKEYQIQFHQNLRTSYQNGYKTLISLPVFDELDNESAISIYLMLSGMNNMDGKDVYLKPDGRFEVPLQVIYENNMYSGPDKKKKQTVDRAIGELIKAEIVSEYSYIKDGRTPVAVSIEPSPWFKTFINSDETNKGKIEQITLELNDNNDD